MPVRIATEQDIPRILEIYGPYILNTTISFEYTVPTMGEFTDRFRQITVQFPWLVWEEEGIVLGYAYGSPPFHRAAYQWSAEASIYLDPQARGRGIGRKLYTALEDVLTRQGYRKVYAIITSDNEDSMAFHRAMGYTFTASFPDCAFKFGKRMGIVWMEKLLNSYNLPSSEPLPFPSIVQYYRNFS